MTPKKDKARGKIPGLNKGEKVKQFINEGATSFAEVLEKCQDAGFEISKPTYAKIKSEMGLTRPRKDKSPAPAMDQNLMGAVEALAHVGGLKGLKLHIQRVENVQDSIEALKGFGGVVNAKAFLIAIEGHSS